MTPESQITGVSGADSSIAGGSVDSTPAALPVSTPEQPAQAEIGGSVTAQSSAGEATPELDESILDEFLPNEELEASPDRYAKALSRVQNSHQRLWEKYRPLQSLESYKALTERGEPEAIQKQLEQMDSLFTPVTDPNTQQRVLDNHGHPAFTTLPFIEAKNAEQSGFALQLLNDVMTFEETLPNGQKLPLWKAFMEDSLGLDPRRLDDYRNIDALAAQSGGQDLNEQLEKIPPQFHDAFKSMPASVRENLLQDEEDARNWHLQQQQERLAGRQQVEAQQKQQAEAQQRYQQELHASVEREQDADIEQQFSEGLSTIMDDIAAKVTFSSDPKQDQALKSIVGAVLLPLRDSSNHAHMKPLFDALGVQIDSAFMENLVAYTQSRREWKALDLANRKAQAEAVLKNAAGPRARVMTKASQIALEVAKALGGQVRAKAETRNGQLETASQIRPTVDGQAAPNGTSLVEMARQAGVNLNDGNAVNAFIMQSLKQSQTATQG
jgi:hypothetical protein